MKKSVYLETSVISYLAGRLSSNLLTAACQQVTSQWWAERRYDYDLFISELVVREARAGNPDAANRRLEYMKELAELTITEEVKQLTTALISDGSFPPRAQADALHVAIAAVHKVDYLLTWNCRHIDNPATKPKIRSSCSATGFTCPEICTPIEIMEESSHDKE